MAGDKKLDPLGGIRAGVGQGGGDLRGLVQQLARPESQMVTVNYGGFPIPIVRGDMPQERWDAYVSQSMSSQPAGAAVSGVPPAPVEVNQSGPASPPPAEVAPPAPVIAQTEVIPDVPAGPTPVPRQGSQVKVSSTNIPQTSQEAPYSALREVQQQILEETGAQEAQLRGQAQIQSAINNEAERLAIEKAASEARLQANFAEQQRAYNNEIERAKSGYQNMVSEMHELSRQGIDPNRFWANKDTGQKVAATIAGALFGFTGQGMQWLQRIDSLVAQDIQAQAADLSRRSSQLQTAMGGQTNLVEMAQRQGLQGRQAFEAAMAGMKQHIASQLEARAAGFANAKLRLDNEAAVAELRKSAAGHLLKLETDSEERGIKQRAAVADEQLKRSQMAQNYAAAQASRGGTKMGLGAADKLADTASAVDAMRRARTLALLLHEKTASQAQTIIAKKYPDLASFVGADVAKISNKIGVLSEYGQKKIQGDVLGKDEADRNLQRVLSGDTSYFDEVEKIGIRDYNNRLKSYRDAGINVSSFSELEQKPFFDSLKYSPEGYDTTPVTAREAALSTGPSVVSGEPPPGSKE